MDQINTRLEGTVIETLKAMFDLDVAVVDEPASDGLRKKSLSAVVQVNGDWVGAVMVDFSPELARRLTSDALDCAPNEVNLDKMRDVLGEIVNVISGNLKAGLPECSALSLPTLVPGLEYQGFMPGAELIRLLSFDCESHSFQVTVFHVPSAKNNADGDIDNLLI